MKKSYGRIPRNYDGTDITTRKLSEILPSVLNNVNRTYNERPDLILAAWKEVIGPKLAAMTEATAFCDGKLFVKVKNSTLYSLLCRHEKQKLLSLLRQQFPNHNIRDIVFRMG